MDFCRYSKSGPKSGKYFQKLGKLKVVPCMTVREMRVPKSVGDVKDQCPRGRDEAVSRRIRYLASEFGARVSLLATGSCGQNRHKERNCKLRLFLKHLRTRPLGLLLCPAVSGGLDILLGDQFRPKLVCIPPLLTTTIPA